MANIGNRVSFLENGDWLVGIVVDFQELSDEVVIKTSDGLTHIVPISRLAHRHFDILALARDMAMAQRQVIEEGIERLPEDEYPTFEDVGIIAEAGG